MLNILEAPRGATKEKKLSPITEGDAPAAVRLKLCAYITSPIEPTIENPDRNS